MATLEQIEKALRAADAAGNVEDARRLAQAYAQAKQSQPSGGTGGTGGRNPANNSDFARMITGKPKEPSILDQLGRTASLGGRSILHGVYDLTSLLGGDLINYAEQKVRGVPMRSQRENADYLADKLGLARPETTEERISDDVSSALVGGGGIMSVGRGLLARAPGVVRDVGEALFAAPRTQIASTVAGTGASSATREAGGGTGAQVVAGLLGGLSPTAIRTGGSAAVRGLIRGGEGRLDANGVPTGGRLAMKRTIDDFRSLGASPSVGQATGSRAQQGVENLLTGGPTSVGVMTRFAEGQAADIGEGLQQRGRSLSPTAGGEQAGKAIVRGISDEGGFIPETRKVADSLYAKVDQSIPADSRVDVGGTRQALADLNASIEGAPNVAKFFQNARIQGIQSALAEDTGGIAAVLSRPGVKQQAESLRAQLTQQAQQQEAAYAQQVRSVEAQNANNRALGLSAQHPAPPRPNIPTAADIDGQVNQYLSGMVDNRLPYEALAKLRTLVGNEIDNYSLVDNVPRSKWKALYGALTTDMEAAATTPQAKAAWKRANAYYGARIGRLEAIEHAIERQGGPEKVYAAVMSGTRDGATTLRAVMQSLPKDGQRALSGAVVKRMGLAAPGVQGNEGGLFSAQTFLTNWNKLAPEARSALFGRHGPQFAADMDRVARVAANVRDGAKVFANPSGTANRAAAIGYGLTLGGTLITGQWPAAAMAAGAGLIANGMARAMTSPRFVNWLAKSTEMPVSALPQQLIVLKTIAAHDPEVSDLVSALEESGQSGQPVNSGANSARR
jgi:hypothetical protein